ncbi:hypothetical protein [Clostridium saccharoperbutylacetonicum]|nr:hypothetical protein [Clostridium saccharoperbutylacetonicum]AQR93400.1 hypothetical protein CLSAP_06980 [Clostridium saccharoperbutylacetonicum]NSB29097.1 hypothetical protein [Clostridium saccharoperbutylacetonicum]
MRRNKPKKSKLPSTQRAKQFKERILFLLGVISAITGIMLNIHNMFK